MDEHLPECPLPNDCKHDYYDEPPFQCANCGESCICSLLRACEQRMLDKVIERAELTFRSDIINPVRDIIEPMLEGK